MPLVQYEEPDERHAAQLWTVRHTVCLWVSVTGQCGCRILRRQRGQYSASHTGQLQSPERIAH